MAAKSKSPNFTVDSGSNQLHCIVRNKTELQAKIQREVIWTERLKCQIELDEIFSQQKVLTQWPLLIPKLHKLPSLDEMLHLQAEDQREVLPFHISLLIKVPPTPILREINLGLRERRLTDLPFLFLDRYATCHWLYLSAVISPLQTNVFYHIYAWFFLLCYDFWLSFNHVPFNTNCVLLSFRW